MRTTLSTLTLAAAAVLSTNAYAGDKEVLDLLVKKGVITAEDRAKAIQESKTKDIASNLNEVFAKEEAVKRLTISGRVQVQYEGMGYSQTTAAGVTTDADSTSDFILRRMYLGAKADVGDGFSGEIVWNFADNTDNSVTTTTTTTTVDGTPVAGEYTSTSTSTSSGTVRGGAFDKAVFTADTSFGKFDVGYQKVQWGQEENTSSSKLMTVERSLVTRYWAESNNGRRVGLGARHTGVHYSNKLTLGEGGQGTFNYGASAVHANQGVAIKGNDFGLYGFVSLDWKPAGITAGLNVAKNDHPAGAEADSAKGYNPYIKWTGGDMTVLAEYIDTDVGTTNPTGYNVTGVYKLDDKVEFVARFAALDTDGRGVKASDGLRNIGTTGTTGATYNEAESLFVGVNYYFNKDNAKIQFGYEMADLEATNGNTADADVFRVQAQILF